MRSTKVAGSLLVGLIGFVLLIAASRFVSCMEEGQGEPSGWPSAQEGELYVDDKLYRKNLPPISPKQTIQLLELSNRLGQTYTPDWRRSWLLLKLSENNHSKCKENFFTELDETIKKYEDYNRIVDYLAYCRGKQLDYCRDNFNDVVAECASSYLSTSVDSGDREKLDLLLRDVVGDEDIIQTGLAQIPTEQSYSGIVQYLESQNIPMNPEELLHPSRGFDNFITLFYDSIGTVCIAIVSHFETAIFVFDNLGPVLDDDSIKDWMAKAKLCDGIMQHSFIKTTYKEYLRQKVGYKRFLNSYGLR